MERRFRLVLGGATGPDARAVVGGDGGESGGGVIGCWGLAIFPDAPCRLTGVKYHSKVLPLANEYQEHEQAGADYLHNRYRVEIGHEQPFTKALQSRHRPCPYYYRLIERSVSGNFNVIKNFGADLSCP